MVMVVSRSHVPPRRDLVQRGDIGSTLHLPDILELTFLRKFIEHQAAGVPHNPRLRNLTAFACGLYRTTAFLSCASDRTCGLLNCEPHCM